MVKREKRNQAESRKPSASDLRKAITKLERRIGDLEGFDVETITERFDARVQALRAKANDTLADLFGYNTIEYAKFRIDSFDTLPHIVGRPKYPLSIVHRGYRKGINDAVIKLKSLKDILEEKSLDLGDERAALAKAAKPVSVAENRAVFIVHGHDNAAKETVARFVEKLELKAIILHEQPNEGRTIIEKFEDYTDVGFAIVLITPDDIGASVNEQGNLKPRARQNVIFELGFFAGKLGRNRVCALYKEGVEIPSDYKGVLFIPMEKEWRLSLAKEIKAAGIAVDLNLVV